ncbi:hypothetical protein IKF76_00575 [Candidatus Saccharibacteria bacterium]|nr:hypothetical protein [Candidatus Saccharibacteria bacterium]
MIIVARQLGISRTQLYRPLRRLRIRYCYIRAL